MYSFHLSKQLDKLFSKLIKRDRIRYESTLKKINEICLDPQRYKNLRHDLKNLKRVHIDSSFVLVFEVDENTKHITFWDLDHHDTIYEKWRGRSHN